MAKTKARDATTAATAGYEAQLWQVADALQDAMGAGEYKHIVLGLLFLNYIAGAFEERHARLVADKASRADPEYSVEDRAQRIFWVPPEARWAHQKALAKRSTISQLVDDVMAAISRDNPALKSMPKGYASPALEKDRLGQLIDLIGNIRVADEAGRAKDDLGRACGSMSSDHPGDGDFRRNLVAGDLVDGMVSLTMRLPEITGAVR